MHVLRVTCTNPHLALLPAKQNRPRGEGGLNLIIEPWVAAARVIAAVHPRLVGAATWAVHRLQVEVAILAALQQKPRPLGGEAT